MKAVADEIGATIPNAFTGDAVAFLQSVYKDPRYPLRMRIDAAAKALRTEWALRPPKTLEERLAVNLVKSQMELAGTEAAGRSPCTKGLPIEPSFSKAQYDCHCTSKQIFAAMSAAILYG